MHQRRTSPEFRWRALGVALLSALVLLAPRRASAHEIPQRVAILGYVRPAGARLELLLRVPLEAMRDHEFPLRADGSLDLVAVRPMLADAATQWIAAYLPLDADGTPVAPPRVTAARVALPSDRSFETLAGAEAGFAAAPLGDETRIVWQQAMLDVRLEYTLPRNGARLVLHPQLAHLGLRTTSVLHLLDAQGSDRILVYEGNPERIALEPRWTDAVRQFVAEGFRHILGGIDHLLFVLCLVLPVRRWRSLVAIVTSFTVAHSLTLGASALGLAPSAGWFPPLVETLIAASIVWLAIENVVLPAARLEGRWAIAFAFGLVHGFGFSFALADRLQFAGGHLATALASFNVGVELGQLLVLAVTLPLLRVVHRHAAGDAPAAREGDEGAVPAARALHGDVAAVPRVSAERLVTIVGSVLVAHTAWHWMTDRGTTLLAFRDQWGWPAFDAAFALGAVRLGLLLALALAAGLALRHILRTVLRP